MNEEQKISLRIEAARLAINICDNNVDLDFFLTAVDVYNFLLKGETPNE